MNLLTREWIEKADGDLHTAQRARQGWEAQFVVMAEQGEDVLIDETIRRNGISKNGAGS